MTSFSPTCRLFLEAAAHQAAPDHFGLEAGLQRFRPDTLALQRFGELLGRQAHPLAHAEIGLIDIAGGRIDAEPLGFPDLHLFVDQLVEHFLLGHLFARGQEVELGTLLDVETGDGFAGDHAGNGLCRQRRDTAGQHGNRDDAAGGRGQRDQSRPERSLMVVMFMSAVSTNSYRVALGTLRHGRASRY